MRSSIVSCSSVAPSGAQELFVYLIIKGVAISGAFFYNHKDAQNQVAVSTEGETFDTCMGHADPMCR